MYGTRYKNDNLRFSDEETSLRGVKMSKVTKLGDTTCVERKLQIHPPALFILSEPMNEAVRTGSSSTGLKTGSGPCRVCVFLSPSRQHPLCRGRAHQHAIQTT